MLCEAGGTGDSGVDEPDCQLNEGELEYDQPDVNGTSAADVLSSLSPVAGVLTYEDSLTTGMSLEVVYNDGDITTRYWTGDEECVDESILLIRATMHITSEDGQFQEVVPVTLSRSSVDPDTVEYDATDINVKMMSGTYQVPEHMSGPNDLDLGEVHGMSVC